MNDEQIVSNALISLKHLKTLFATFSMEASKDLTTVVDDIYSNITTMQRDLFTYMVDENFMKVTYQTTANIDKVYKKYEKKSCGA